MKKTIFSIICFLLIMATSLMAQEKKNVIKWHPLSLYSGSVGIGYERAINERNSFDVTVRIPFEQNLNASFTEFIYPSDEYSVSNSTTSTLGLRLAYRHYTGQQVAPKGFYLEPYVSYQKIKPGIEGNSGTKTGKLSGSFTSTSGGLQLGYQFLIKKTVTIDLYFLGLGAGVTKAELTGTTTGDISEYKQDIEDAIKDLPVIGDKTTVNVENNAVKVKVDNIITPSFRAGISVGFAF
jgi:hypothetical protein